MRSAIALILMGILLGACSVDSGGPSGSGNTDAGAGGNGDSAVNGNDGSTGPLNDGGVRPPRDASGDADNTCERQNVRTQEEWPAVLLVLDRSGSMYTQQEDRWTPAVTAINSMVGTFQDRFQFGLILYPDQTGNESQQCSTSASSIKVAPAVRSASAIASALSGTPAAMTGGGTPTHDALLYARNQLVPYADERRYVFLITDGSPNCNPSLNPATCQCTIQPCQLGWQCLDRDRTVNQVMTLATAGVQTYVIGYQVDASDWVETLNAMAAAGGTDETEFIQVGNGPALEAKLRELAGQAASCTFQLEQAAPSDPKFVRVTVTDENGASFEVDHVDANRDTAVQGWRFDGNSIEVIGAACGRLKNGLRHDVEIVVECVPVVI